MADYLIYEILLAKKLTKTYRMKNLFQTQKNFFVDKSKWVKTILQFIFIELIHL